MTNIFWGYIHLQVSKIGDHPSGKINQKIIVESRYCRGSHPLGGPLPVFRCEKTRRLQAAPEKLDSDQPAASMRGAASLIFSIEMPNESLMIRILASMTKIESRQIRKGFLKNTDWSTLVNAVARVADTPIFFDDSPLITPGELRLRARKAKKDHDIKLIVLDYLQLMTPASRRERREQEVAEISRTLKSIARELTIPVIGVSQLNRAVDSRPDKRPLMSDLRESGAIEQDADVIAFIYRDEVYSKGGENPERGIAEINIVKQRHGPIFTIKTVFSDKYQQFENIVSEQKCQLMNFGDSKGSENEGK